MSEEKTLGEIAYETWCYDISHDAWQAVADAVVAAHEARRWRSIETAPKDGAILAWSPERSMVFQVVWRMENNDWSLIGRDGVSRRHTMPNKPLTDAALAELDRLHAETGTSCDKWLKACIATFNAYQPMRQRLTDAESRLADAERKGDVYHAALSEIYYRAIPLNEDSGHSTIAHIAADAMRGNNGNPLADRDAQQRREGAAEYLEAAAEKRWTLSYIVMREEAKRLREGK